MLEGLIRETDALGVLTGDGCLLVDKDGIIVHATAEAGPFFGLPASQLTGLPLGLRLDGAPLSLPGGTTLADLIAQLGHSPQAVGTAVNGEFVARGARASRVLAEGDAVLLFQPIVGG